MNIGVTREIKAQENRVSMVPNSVAELVKRGHRVLVQRGAGEGASFSDAQYEAAGATLVFKGPRSRTNASFLILKCCAAGTGTPETSNGRLPGPYRSQASIYFFSECPD